MLQVHHTRLNFLKEKKKGGGYHCDISSFPNTALHADTQPHAFRLFLCFPNTENRSLSGPMAVLVDFRSHVPFPSCPFCLSFQLRGGIFLHPSWPWSPPLIPSSVIRLTSSFHVCLENYTAFAFSSSWPDWCLTDKKDRWPLLLEQ